VPKTLPFLVEVEDVAVGRFMLLMNKTPGVISYRADMKGKSPKPNGDARAHNPDRKPAGRFEVSGDQAIIELIHKKGPMLSTALADAFTKQGRSPKSISSCLHKLRTDGLLQSVPEGYALTKKARDSMRSKKKK
jgi:hypothetical protein